VALFSGVYSPVQTLTAQTFDSAATELDEYDSATHPIYVEAAPAGTPSPSVTNSADKAEFVINATVTARGAALVSTATKPTPATTGNVLLCCSAFSAARSLVDDDELYITYTITASDA